MNSPQKTPEQIQTSPQDERYDLIVVGSGLGGMTVAATQARRGKKVLVVEKHKVLGGYASVFGRSGKSFDTSLHLLGGAKTTLVAQILKDAGVYDKLKLVKSPNLCELQLEEGGETIALPNGDIKGIQALLEARFPDEKWAIRRWFWFMRRYGRQVGLDDRVRRLSVIPQGIALNFYPIFAPFLVGSRIALPRLSIALRAKNPELRKLLLHFSGYYGLPNDEVNALLPMVANYSYYSDGGYYLEGGGHSISRHLSMVVRKNGGRIITGRAVTRINTAGNQVTGVVVEGEEAPFHAKEVVCSANPFAVYGHMLPDHPVAQKQLAKIRKMDLSMTCSVMFLHIDVPIEQLNGAMKDTYEFFQMSKDSEEDYYKYFQNRSGFDGDYDRDGMVVTLHSHLDPHALGKEGGGTAFDVFFCDNFARWDALTPEEYAAQKAIEQEKMLDKLETVLPGVREHINVVELATPKTMQKFTGNEGGAIYGFSQKPSQSGFHRFGIKSPLRGLHFVSAWSNPGGGYEGVLRAADNYINPHKKAAVLTCLALIALSVFGKALLL